VADIKVNIFRDVMSCSLLQT